MDSTEESLMLLVGIKPWECQVSESLIGWALSTAKNIMWDA